MIVFKKGLVWNEGTREYRVEQVGGSLCTVRVRHAPRRVTRVGMTVKEAAKRAAVAVALNVSVMHDAGELSPVETPKRR